MFGITSTLRYIFWSSRPTRQATTGYVIGAVLAAITFVLVSEQAAMMVMFGAVVVTFIVSMHTSLTINLRNSDYEGDPRIGAAIMLLIVAGMCLAAFVIAGILTSVLGGGTLMMVAIYLVIGSIPWLVSKASILS